MAKMIEDKVPSRSIRLDDEVYSAFGKAAKVHGSYNKALRFMLSAGGVFEPNGRNEPAVNEPSRGPLLKPSEKKK